MWQVWAMACVAPDSELNARAPKEEADDPPVAPAPDADAVEDVGSNRLPRDDASWLTAPFASTPADGADPEDLHDDVVDAFFAEGTLYDFHISLPPNSRSSLTKEPKEWVPATFHTNEGSWPVLVALKGTNSFRDLSGKAGFKVSFVGADPASSYHGLRRLTLNSMLQDSSMLHEHTAYWLYRRLGLPAPRHTYAHVTVDGTDYGLHGVVETMDEQLLKNVFRHDTHGNLYEGNVTDFATGRTKRFDLEESDGEWEPFVDIDAAIAILEPVSSDDFLAALDSVFDLDELLHMWAVEIVTTNVDGYTWFANNYMAYHGKEKWYMLPIGHDQCFEWYRDVTDYSKLEGVLVSRCANAPACRARLEQAMLDILPEWEQGDFEAMVVAETALIQNACSSDPRAELACDTAHVLRFVQERPATIREELSAEPEDE